MIIENVKLFETNESVTIKLVDSKIGAVFSKIPANSLKGSSLLFENAIAFPGLINSHDHLDFNLFNKLGNEIYEDYTEWGKHIHNKYKTEIDQVLKIPESLRSTWGIYKNLICGVTTVVNHGKNSGMGNNLITVLDDLDNIHSVKFEKNWKRKLNNPLKLDKQVVIHIGEGTNAAAEREINDFNSWNIFKRKTIGIHAVAMNEKQAKKFEAIVWCPQSNFYLLAKTAHVDQLKTNTNILFGTDSTLTADWNFWSHLETARSTGLLSDKELFNSFTKNAAKVWRLNSGEISAGKDADIVVAKLPGEKNDSDDFFNLSPARILLVISKGRIVLFDESLISQLTDIEIIKYSKVNVDGVCKFVKGDLHGLIKNIKSFNPEIDFYNGRISE